MISMMFELKLISVKN